ncbi:MAG: hypothetical protein R3F62_30235 [Planctomycetota bacterium]
MGYSIHVRRETPISPEEWSAAVAHTPGVRMAADQARELRNPRTGEVIRLAGGGFDAEVSLEGEWRKALFYDRGKVTFRATPRFGSDDELRLAARSLASALQATIVGDEGEAYP